MAEKYLNLDGLDEVVTQIKAKLLGKVDVTAGVTNVAYDSSSKKLKQTINGSASDIVIFGDNAFTSTSIPTAASQLSDYSSLAQASDVSAIEAKIPSEASSSNKLADKAFVNSSISTATATFRGTKNLVSDLSLTISATHSDIATALGTAITTADANDYCFVQIPVANDTPTVIGSIERYKYASGWEYEYTLNNSGFTAAQWAAINSGITTSLVTQIGTNQSNISSLDTNKVAKTTTIAGVDLQDNITKSELLTALNVADGAEVNVQSDWNQTNTNADDYIKNKPTIPTDTNQKIKTSSVTFGNDDVVEIAAGSNVQVAGDATNKTITISATDTTYSSQSASQGGTTLSLVTTGEKYTWNHKQNALTAGDNITITNNVISASDGIGVITDNTFKIISKSPGIYKIVGTPTSGYSYATVTIKYETDGDASFNIKVSSDRPAILIRGDGFTGNDASHALAHGWLLITGEYFYYGGSEGTDTGWYSRVSNGSIILTASDVKNNLTSTDTNKPLSAAQGKALKDEIDTLPDTAITTAEIDALFNPTT